MCIFGRPYKQVVGRLFWAHVVENEHRHPYRQAIGDALMPHLADPLKRIREDKIYSDPHQRSKYTPPRRAEG